MDILRLKAFKTLPRLWLSFFLMALIVVGVLSFAFEIHTAQDAVARYVGIWEDDIARAQLFQGDPSLQVKIMRQLNEVHSAVSATAVKNIDQLHCLFSSSLPVTYNSLPVGSMRVCYSPVKLLGQALISPVMSIGVFLALCFLVFGLRRDFISRLQAHKLESELFLNREIAEISRQVAHDIRGPLTALTTLSHLSHEMSLEKKELLQVAVARIRGIAEDLLKKGKGVSFSDSKERPSHVENAVTSNLATVTESLLKEYRFSHTQVQWTWHNYVTSADTSVPLDEIKIQRILSNMFNNALEAIPEKEATIDITLLERQDHFLLQIMDNGCGIPEDILPRLAQEGVTHGKENGNGLGLFDARKTLENLGGELQIRSREGVGTQVILLFPKRDHSPEVHAL